MCSIMRLHFDLWYVITLKNIHRLSQNWHLNFNISQMQLHFIAMTNEGIWWCGFVFVWNNNSSQCVKIICSCIVTNNYYSIMQLWFVRIIWLPFNLVYRALEFVKLATPYVITKSSLPFKQQKQNTDLRLILSINVLRIFHIKFGKFNFVSCLHRVNLIITSNLYDKLVKNNWIFNMKQIKSTILPYFLFYSEGST